MPLAKYQSKRRFSKTPEPRGKLRKSGAKQLEFVIQKHHASRLHYDFRLELDGVLKSWAVPKGPSLSPGVRRLAMMVEDHPYEYRKFEGAIPEGNYGAGNVIIWDRGWYEPYENNDNPENKLKDGLKKGDLKFILHGQKLKGAFVLVHSGHMDKNAWLLIKKDDRYASDKDVTEQEKSVISGRPVDQESSFEDLIKAAPKAKMPKAVTPMLATLVDEPFDKPDWLYEIKWDGYRAVGAWNGKQAELYSRNNLDFSHKYPPVYEALRQLKQPAVIDGEIVTLDADGRSRFEWLQNYSHDPQGELAYFVFDILWCAGRDLRGLPLEQRKAILKAILPGNGSLQFSDHIKGQGKQFFASAQAQKLEGIMAKQADSTYADGRRSKQWLKIKTHLRQEAIIGGFTEPKGSRKYIGALIVGVRKNGQLVYTGHAGGGIPSSQLKSLRQRLEKLEIVKSPFAQKVKPNAPVHWAKPKLLCEVTFSEWTSDGRMRQPIFMGLREDKATQEVTREKPQPLAKTPAAKKDAKSKVEFSHLGKVFWPEKGYTKGDLVDYYRQAAPYMLPYIKGRPHSLLRQPNGYKGKSFFQKDVDHMPPAWIRTEQIYSESNQAKINYLVADSAESLLYMVQLGCIEINPWNSTIKHLDKPDWIVMDLDPEAIAFKKVVETAKAVKQICDELEIASYPKTSGKSGIHIYIPMNAKYTYDQSKQFGEILANLVHERTGKFTSLERSPSKRQQKVYVDYLQNREGQTLAAPYSVRPTKDASVSTPLHWDEVNSRLDPAKFTIKTTPERLKRVGDLWQPVLGKGVDIKKILAAIQ